MARPGWKAIINPPPAIAPMSDGRRSDMNALDIVGIDFRDPALLTQALTHSSFANEAGGKKARDNERLEFLGDAVLNLIVADLLYRKMPHVSEGELTQLRAALVKKESLAGFASGLGLDGHLRIGKGETLNGRGRDTLLCNAFEAVVGAVYIDRGLRAVKRFVTPMLLGLLDEVIATASHIDARSALQELAQARWKETPQYVLMDASGPEHQRVFRVEVRLRGKPLAIGVGKSKVAAAMNGSKEVLDQIRSGDLTIAEDA